MKRLILLCLILALNASVYLLYSRGMTVKGIELYDKTDKHLCLDEGGTKIVTYKVTYANTDPKASETGDVYLVVEGPAYFPSDTKEEVWNNKWFQKYLKSGSSQQSSFLVKVKCAVGATAQEVNIKAKGDGDTSYLGGPSITIFPKYEDLTIEGQGKINNGQTSKYNITRACSTIEGYRTKWYIDKTSIGEGQIVSIDSDGWEANVKALGGSFILCADVYDGKYIKTLKKRVEAPYVFDMSASANTICKAGDIITYTLNNTSKISNTTWTVGPEFSIISSDKNSAKVKLTLSNYAGFVVVEANVTSIEDTKAKSENKSVWTGIPNAKIRSTSDDGKYYPNRRYSFFVDDVKGTTPTWSLGRSLSGATLDNSNGANTSVKVMSRAELDKLLPMPSGGKLKYGFDLQLKLQNICGCSYANNLYYIDYNPPGQVTPPLEGDCGGINQPPCTQLPSERMLPIRIFKSIDIYTFPNGKRVKRLENVEYFDIYSIDISDGIYMIKYTDMDGNITSEKVKK